MFNKTIVDARPSGNSDKLSSDRQRFIRRAKAQIKEGVKRAISKGDIKGLEKGRIRVPVKDLTEPTFQHDGNTGSRDRVYTGNENWVEGDKIEKPEDGGSGPGGGGSPDGEGEDDFSFMLTPEEFYDFLFEDLALPDLVKKKMKQITKIVRQRAGFVTSGNPAQLDLKQTYKFAYARHKALGRPTTNDIETFQSEFDAKRSSMTDEARNRAMQELAALELMQKRVPLIDNIDLRYRNYPAKPAPITQAVMYCVMDVSGSMDENRKDLAKRFFLLLYVWLMRQFNSKVEIVFIRHTSYAQIVDEDTFFYSTDIGGTVVSSALKLARENIHEKYSPQDWNIYVCYAGDGDNYEPDNSNVMEELNSLVPLTQYFSYLQVADTSSYYPSSSSLWATIEKATKKWPNVHQVLATSPDMIWPVFRSLFEKS